MVRNQRRPDGWGKPGAANDGQPIVPGIDRLLGVRTIGGICRGQGGRRSHVIPSGVDDHSMPHDPWRVLPGAVNSPSLSITAFHITALQ